MLYDCISSASSTTDHDAHMAAKILEEKISAACDFALPRKRPHPPGKPPVFWWNQDIAHLRGECVKAKRKNTGLTTRIARLRQRAEERDEQFDDDRAGAELNVGLNSLREAKRQLKRAIAASKKHHWNNLIRTIDSDPFGKPYKIVMQKL